MRRMTAKLIAVTALAGVLIYGAANARAGGYYYRARSFYVTPPIYANLPVFGQSPIVYFEPVVTAPAPVAGYYAPISDPVTVAAPATDAAPFAVPASGIRERQVSTPHRTRYQYDAVYPDGTEYQYRYKRNGGHVRFTEHWAN